MNFVRTHGAKLGASLALLSLSASQAFAALDPAVQTALDDGKTMGVAIAVGVLILVIAIAAVKHARRGA